MLKPTPISVIKLLATTDILAILCKRKLVTETNVPAHYRFVANKDSWDTISYKWVNMVKP